MERSVKAQVATVVTVVLLELLVAVTIELIYIFKLYGVCSIYIVCLVIKPIELAEHFRQDH